MRAANAVPAGCFTRADFGAFTIFVATFVPSGTRFHHAHDDLLSYSIYLDGEELVCDPGMPGYGAAGAGYAEAQHHNGLRDVAPFAPRPGLLVTTSIAGARVDVDHGVELEIAATPTVGRARRLRVAAIANGIEIEECVVGGAAGSFFLCLDDAHATLETGSVRAARARFSFEGLDAPSLVRWERARTYGERRPCTTLRAGAVARTVLRIHDVR